MKRFFSYTVVIALLLGVLGTSCRARDCKGRKKTVKTAMGGWL